MATALPTMATALVEEQLKHGTAIRFKGDDRELL